MSKLTKIRYDDLNARQQENYNFHKAACVLAEYGYNCIRLSDDWEGADFLVYHKIDQWTFHVIGTKDLDSEVGTQKSIGIHPLKKLVERLTGRCEVGYDDLNSVIKSML